MTGGGQTNPGGQDGLVAAVPLPISTLAVTVTIGGKPAHRDLRRRRARNRSPGYGS